MIDALQARFGRFCYDRYHAAPFASKREWLWWKLWFYFG